MKLDRRAAGMALIALSLAAIGLALWEIGGPEQARMDRRDMTRMHDLQAIARHIQCRNRTGAAPAAEPAPTPDCPLPERLADPYTGTPYAITLPGDGAVRLCAGFEGRAAPEPLWMRAQFDSETGCLTVLLADGADTSLPR